MKKPGIQKSIITTAWFMILLVLNLSCFENYYRSKTDKAATAQKIEALRNAQNYIIIHHRDRAWHMTSIVINVDSQTMTGKLNSELPSNRLAYQTTKQDKLNKYYKESQARKPAIYKSVLDEVHIFLKDSVVVDELTGVIQITDINRIDVYDPDTGATSASHVLGALGIVVGLVVIVLVIAVLTKSSCPFVYIYNGESYVFAGEIYSGSIYGSLERDDYLLLPGIKPMDEYYSLYISNKLKEKQYTNLAELWSIEHPVGSKIIPDRHGRIHSVLNPESPTKAFINEQDVSRLLSEKDSHQFMFNDEHSFNDINQLYLSFSKPEIIKDGKLVLRAKNTFWGDYCFGEFTKYFGKGYQTWIESQRKNSPTEHIEWMIDQGLVMKVYAETSKGWEFVDYFDLVGPMSARDLIMNLDLSDIKTETVNIRIDAGYMLWELDYAAMDFSLNNVGGINKLELHSALDQDGKNVKPNLLENDNRYLKQFKVGDETELRFRKTSVASPRMTETMILHSRGFYEHIREYEGLPDLTKLQSFKKPGAFPKFVKEKLVETQKLMEVAPIGVMARN